MNRFKETSPTSNHCKNYWTAHRYSISGLEVIRMVETFERVIYAQLWNDSIMLKTKPYTQYLLWYVLWGRRDRLICFATEAERCLVCPRARLSIKFFRIVQLAYWRMGSITDGKNFFVVVFILCFLFIWQTSMTNYNCGRLCVFVN